VSGPVIAGSMRYLGLGLFQPSRGRAVRGSGTGSATSGAEAADGLTEALELTGVAHG